MHARPIDRVGIVGIGGLGHLGVKFAAAYGCEVTAFTSSEHKFDEARGFGGHQVVSSRDAHDARIRRPTPHHPATRALPDELNQRSVRTPHRGQGAIPGCAGCGFSIRKTNLVFYPEGTVGYNQPILTEDYSWLRPKLLSSARGPRTTTMVKQEIQFTHRPDQIRLAAIQLAVKRLRSPSIVLILVVLLLLIPVGLITNQSWLLIVPFAVCGAILACLIQYIITSPRNYCGVTVQMSIRDDGIHFSGPERSGEIRWAGFREIYLLKRMWAVFFKNSDAVTLIPTDQLESETLDFVIVKLRENNVRIHGNAN